MLFLEFDNVCFPMSYVGWCFPSTPREIISPFGVGGNSGKNLGGTHMQPHGWSVHPIQTFPNESFLYDMAISRLNTFSILYYLLKAAPLLYFHLLAYLLKSSNALQNQNTHLSHPPKSPHFNRQPPGTRALINPFPAYTRLKRGEMMSFEEVKSTSFPSILHPEKLT